MEEVENPLIVQDLAMSLSSAICKTVVLSLVQYIADSAEAIAAVNRKA